MPALLHILTQPDDALAREIIRCQQESKPDEVRVIDLTNKSPDYKDLLENIFAADSMHVW